MIEYAKVEAYLRKHVPIHDDDNISDYWFANRKRCVQIVNGRYPHHSQIFDLQVRWRSAFGQTLIDALKEHIKQIKQITTSEASERFKRGDMSFVYATIDLNDFSFTFDDKANSIQDFALSFPTSRIGGWRDLRGIPLDGFEVIDCKLVGLNFSSSSFVGANFQQVYLVNCNFVSSNFNKSRFVAVRYDEMTALGGISFRGAFVNTIALDDKNFGTPLEFTEISYLQIVSYIWNALVFKQDDPYKNNAWTRFQVVDTRQLNDSLLSYQKNYINWLQSLLSKIDGFRGLRCGEKTSLLASIFLTKYWRSAAVLGFSSAVVNVLFALIYMSMPSEFCNFHGEAVEAIYYSVVTFTTLGYGDIFPVGGIGRMIAVIEVIIGYMALGSFLVIIGRKISQRY